jgi:hypothetical protein
MPNGKIGDHPLTDILIHHRKTYGRKADNVIRKIAELSSDRELQEWWASEIGWDCKRKEVLRRARAKYDDLLLRAKEGGWETDH